VDQRKLRYFLVLAEEMHFGRAAHRLSLSQPPLSLAIRQLEDEIGAKLFERNSRNVSLTVAGLALQREAQVLLRRTEETRVLVKAIADGKGGQIRLGFGGSMLYRGLPKIVEAFRQRSPSTEVRVQELNSNEQLEALNRDEIDFGFIHDRAAPPGLEGFCYHSEPFVACVPGAHRCAKARTLELSRLKQDDFILFARSGSPNYYQSIIATCLAAGFNPNVRYEVRQWMSVVSFVANGMGVALVPQSLRLSNVSGAAFVAIQKSKVVSETWCVWRADNGRGVDLANMIDAARAQSSILARTSTR